MDSIEIYKSLGLKEEKINEMMNAIFEKSPETNAPENEKDKILKFTKAFNDLNITEEDITEPIEILYAKIMFIASQTIEINNQTKKYIFLDEDDFYKTFGITYEELLNIYPFNEYEENQAKRK